MRGLTVIELIIVVAIIGILSAFSLSGFTSFRNNQAVVTSGQLITTALNKARTNTIASFNDSVYGVHFETDSVTVFIGDTYSSGASTNEVTSMPRGMSLSSISISGSSAEVVFNKITGDTDNDGSVIVSLDADTSKNLTISISDTGIIGIE